MPKKSRPPGEREAEGRAEIERWFESVCPNILGNPFIPQSPLPKQALGLGMHLGRADGAAVFEMLYGGAAGPGKSSFLLMAAAQFAWKHPEFAAILFRRTFTELSQPGALMDRALEWWRPRGVAWDGTSHIFRFPSGAKVSMAYLKNATDHLRYQGAEFQLTCVALDTPVLLPDGSSKAACMIRPGEMVQTLEGPRRVTRTWRPGVKPTVRVTTPHGEAVVSADHPILLASGWVCPRAVMSNECPPGEPTYATSEGTRRDHGQPFESRSVGSSPRPGVDPAHPAVEVRQGCVASSEGTGTAAAGSYALPRGGGPLVRSSALAVLHGPGPLREGPSTDGWILPGALARAPAWSSSEGCPGGCCCDSGRRDERSRPDREGGQECIPSPVGVGERTRWRWRVDDLANTRPRTQFAAIEVPHPYTSRMLKLAEVVHLAQVELDPAGEAEVVDLSVEGASHYIIAGARLVVRNCWDELTQWETPRQYEYVGLSRVRRPARSLVPLRTLSTSNPGGPGHQWVRDRFVGDPANGIKAPHIYLPGRLSDNPFIDRESYIAGLMHLHPTVREQLLNGDWTARDPGDYFRAEWFGPLLDPEEDVWPSSDCVRVRWWDLAASEAEDAARTAGVRMARHRSGVRAIEHCRAFRATPGKRDDLIVQTAKADGPGVIVGIEIEGGSGGPAQFAALEKRLKSNGLRVAGARPKAMLSDREGVTMVRNTESAKEARADPVASCLERGHQRRGECPDTGGQWWGLDRELGLDHQRDGIRLFAGAWTQAYLDEVEGFPDGPTCDIVDATSGAWAYLEAHAYGYQTPIGQRSKATPLAEPQNVHPTERPERVSDRDKGGRWKP